MEPDKYPNIREYRDEEHRKEVQTWSILVDQTDNEPGQTIRLTYLAGGAVRGVYPKYVKNIARKWDNQGIAVAIQNGEHVALTKKGTKVDDPTKVE